MEPGESRLPPRNRGGWREWLVAWKDFRAEGRDYRVLDGARVLMFGRMRGIGRLSGTSTDNGREPVSRSHFGEYAELLVRLERSRERGHRLRERGRPVAVNRACRGM
jgi:hypothetical protein